MSITITVSATDTVGATATTTTAATVASGFPDATTTGPVVGTVFTNKSGVLQSTADGQIFENLNLTGAIQIQHHNCIVRNCIINATGANFDGPLGVLAAVGCPDVAINYNLKVLNCRIYSVPTSNRAASQLFDGVGNAIEVGYCDISFTVNAIDIGQPICGAAYIHDNYIHDFACWDAQQAPPDGDHTDGLQTYDISYSGGMRVIHNTVLGWQTAGTYPGNPGGSSSCLAFITGQHDLTVDSNLFAGGSYSLYGPSQNGGGGHPVNVHVTNNHFSTQFYPTCGAYGTHSGWDNTAQGFIWSGNVWHDGPNAGKPVNVGSWPN